MTIFLAGGGTGGHVFPLIGVADALHALSPSEELICIGTRRGIEQSVVPRHGYRLELLEVHPIRGGGFGGVLRGLFHAASALPGSVNLLKRYQPRVVFSVGGYAAGPISAAARLLGVPLTLLEPNAAIGLANAMTAPLVDRAYTAFAESESAFPPNRVRRFGVPLRRGFEPKDYRLPDGHRRLLILGGSQGARSLNETVPEALVSFKDRIRVVHQCGAKHEVETQARYQSLGMAGCVRVVPFIADMPLALADSDLVVGRSGASAVSEIAAVGRPSLLVPYPHASADHQRRNAEALERAGAAICVPAMEASAARLAAEFKALLEADERLRKMAGCARSFGKPHAARDIARDLLKLIAVSAISPGLEADRAAAPIRIHQSVSEGVR